MSVHEEGAVHRKIAERLENTDLLAGIMAAHEVFWLNENTKPVAEALQDIPLGSKDVQDAADRLERFRPYLASAFPETAAQGGLIESELRELKGLPEIMEQRSGRPFVGRLLMKLDSHLPISGSIKARGGIYEILKLAEAIALERGFLRMEEDYVKLDTPEARALFGEYSVAVGSTGNLGLSIGIIGAKLGFRVRVHMSADARTWKKELLREKGVTVIEHESDYSAAITEGRRQTEGDPKCHFVDDENSHELFLGYSVVGERIRAQFEAMGIPVDRDHPLFTYLPCGVGGGPGGVAFGLKLAFGDDVHCFFAEPTHAPCMLLGLYSGMHEGISVRDLGLDVVTEADGLAVGRPSGFVGRTLRHLIDGAYTVDDADLLRWLTLVAQTESVKLEPSGLAGVPGALRVGACGAFGKVGLSANATHLVWATGGGMVPGEVWNAYDKEGVRLLSL